MPYNLLTNLMEPRPRFELVPGKKRPPTEDDPIDDKDTDVDDVDKEDDQRWQEWWNDESGKIKTPLPPQQEPEQPGLHITPPEMDYDPQRDQEWHDQRKDHNDPDSVPRGSWEMKS